MARRIILDTNVFSEIAAPKPNDKIVRWLDTLGMGQVYTTSLTKAELFFGVERLPEGARKLHLGELYRKMFDRQLAGRVLAFDEESAVFYARIMTIRRRAGRSVMPIDAQIAAIAMQHDAVLATRNTKDFSNCGVTIFDPWSDDEIPS